MDNSTLIVTNEPNSFFANHWKYLQDYKQFYFLEVQDYSDYDNNYKDIKLFISKHDIQVILFQYGLFPIKIHQLESFSLKKICFIADDDWMFEITTRHIYMFFDHIITTYPSKKTLYQESAISNVIYSQWGYNRSLFNKIDIKKTIDVSFIGAPHSDRVSLFKYLVQNNVNLSIYGHGWDKFTELKKFWKGIPTYTESVGIINKSKICLNPAKASTQNSIQIKGRTFEIAGCGSFQLTEHISELENYFNIPDELVTYNSREDLLEKIKYYLINETERESTASRAFLRAKKDHTWDARFEEINEAINSSKKFNIEKMPGVTVIYFAFNKIDPGIIDNIINQKYIDSQVLIYSTNQQNISHYKIFNRFDDLLSNIKHPITAFIQNGDHWDELKLFLHCNELAKSNAPNKYGAITNYSIKVLGNDRIIRYSYRQLYFNNSKLILNNPSSISLYTSYLKQLAKNVKFLNINDLLNSANLLMNDLVYVDLINPVIKSAFKKMIINGQFREIADMLSSQKGWVFRKKLLLKSMQNQKTE